MERVVAVDLCNTVAAVNEAIADCLGLGSKWRWKKYSLAPAGIRDEEAWFRAHPEVFAEALPLPGAAEVLGRVASAGWKIVYLSARPPWARGMSLEWLKKHGFPRGELVLTRDKAEACRRLGIRIVVEDAPHEVRSLRRVAQVAVIGQPYNGSRLGWPEVEQILAGMRGGGSLPAAFLACGRGRTCRRGGTTPL